MRTQHWRMGTSRKHGKDREEENWMRRDNLYIIIIILSCWNSLDSSKPIQKRISINNEGLGTPVTT